MLVSRGTFAAAGDKTTGQVIDQPGSAAQHAVDRRIQTQVVPLVAEAIAEEPTIVTAAVDAVATAAVQNDAFRSSFLTRKIRARTIIKNGNFANTADWAVYTGGTGLSASGNVISVTGGGTASGVGIASGAANRPTGKTGHVLYFRAGVRSVEAGASSIMVRLHSGGVFAYLNGTTTAVTNPTGGTWYDVTGTIATPAAFNAALMELQALVVHPNAGATAGKHTEIRKVTLVDLTDDFGAGMEPTAAEFTGWLDLLGGFIADYADVTDRPIVFHVAGVTGDVTAPALAAALDPYLQGAVSIAGVSTALIGDSQTWRVGPKIRASDGGFAPKGAHFPSIGWVNWANAALGGSLRIVSNLAVSGKRADEVRAEQLPTILAMPTPPALCAAYVGINDVVQGRTSAAIIADLDAIFTGLRDKGITVITGTLMATGSLTTPQRVVLFAVNAWLKAQAQSRAGFVLIDWFAHMADAAGVAIPGLFVDGLHPTPAGAARMGAVAAAAVDGLIPRVDVLPLPGDPGNVCPNPAKTGTAGTKGAGVTGTVATSWEVAADTGTVVATAALTPRTDGVAGNWQSIQLTSGNLRATAASVTAAAGQTWEAVVELELDGNAAEHLTRIAVQVNVAGTGQVLTCLGLDPDVDSAEGAALTAAPSRMVLRTPSLTLATGATGLVLNVHTFGGTGAGAIRIGRTGLARVS